MFKTNDFIKFGFFASVGAAAFNLLTWLVDLLLNLLLSSGGTRL